MAEAPSDGTYNALWECVDRLNALLEKQRERIAQLEERLGLEKAKPEALVKRTCLTPGCKCRSRE